MTAGAIPADPKQPAVVQGGEGQALELKRSTGELKEGMQSLCAFLNGSGGMVLFGVRPDGAALGQEVSDQTLRDIAQAADRFEPPAHVSIHRIKVKAGREAVVAAVEGGVDLRPFTYEGRPSVKQLSGRHDSKPTNPLIAGAFHRTGAVEVWGRGTNRVRKALLKFIADFANWDNAANRTYLEVSRALVKAAHGEEPPLVVDPFAGGGSIRWRRCGSAARRSRAT
jgi:predicted HTH transcriptional regulator